MLGYGQRELLEFLECGYQSGYKRKWGSPKPPQFIDRKWLPSLDNLRNFLLLAAAKTPSLFQMVHEIGV